MFTRHGLVSLHVHIQNALHCFIAHNDLCVAVWRLPDVHRHTSIHGGLAMLLLLACGRFLPDCETLWSRCTSCLSHARFCKRMGPEAARRALLTVEHTFQSS